MAKVRIVAFVLYGAEKVDIYMKNHRSLSKDALLFIYAFYSFFYYFRME